MALTRTLVWPAPHQLLRWAGLLLVATALGWAIPRYGDYLLFYLRQHRPVRDAADFDRQLRATGLPMQALGSVTYGPNSWPVWALSSPPTATPMPTICIMGSIHGNEPAGAATLLAWAQDIAAQPQISARHRYALLPLANPWGWERNLRHNGENQDIARQFQQGGAQEATLVQQWLQHEHCTLLLDLHEDRIHRGFYLLAYASPQPQVVEAAAQRIATTTGVTHSSQYPQGVLQVAEQDFQHITRTTPALWARQNGVPHALILETFDGMPLDQRVRIQRRAVEELVQTLVP